MLLAVQHGLTWTHSSLQQGNCYIPSSTVGREMVACVSRWENADAWHCPIAIIFHAFYFKFYAFVKAVFLLLNPWTCYLFHLTYHLAHWLYHILMAISEIRQGHTAALLHMEPWISQLKPGPRVGEATCFIHANSVNIICALAIAVLASSFCSLLHSRGSCAASAAS